MRLGVRDELEPGRLFGGDLGFPHPPLPLLVGSGRDDRRRSIAEEPQRIVQVTPSQVLEGPADLSPGRGVEDIGGRIIIQFLHVGWPRGRRQGRNQTGQAIKDIAVQPDPGCLIAQQGPIGGHQTPLCRSQPDPPLEFVELLLPLGDLDRGQLGIVGRTGFRSAQ